MKDRKTAKKVDFADADPKQLATDPQCWVFHPGDKWHGFDGLPDGCPLYFVHSFAPVGVDDEECLGTAEYGDRFVCAVERGALYGVQFHPEKSSAHGLRLLENFASVCTPVGAPS